MNIGKLTNEELDKIILSKIKPVRDDIILRSGIGIDCGGITMNGADVCMVSCDPITAASKDAGKLAVHVSCNDVAATGATPVAMLVTMLIPPTSTMNEIEELFEQIQVTCEELKVDIIGGHTEITDTVNKTIICTTVIGKANKNEFVSGAGAQIGDAIVMTKLAAMEGTTIIASDFPQLIDDVLSEEEIKKCKSLVDNISVVKEGMMAKKLGVTAMHDVTEGGILGALWEICKASDCGALVSLDKVPMLNETTKICNKLNLNPFKLISSGCMLMTAKDGEHCVDELMKEGIPATIIGKIKAGNIIANYNGNIEPVLPPDKDELYKVFK